MLSNFIIPMKCRASKKRHEGQRSHRESDQRHDVLISDNPNDLSRSIIDREDTECATEFSIEETRCVLQGGLPMPQRSDLPEEWGAHIRHEAKRLSQ